MSHSWRSTGQKRTVVWLHEPSKELLKYLWDMQDAIGYGLEIAYRDGTRNQRSKIPSPIQLRREIREWFYSRYNYARHHINPICRTVVAMLRSYHRNHHGELRIPDVRKLAMRVDIGLFKLVGDMIRVTLQPNSYVWLPINAKSRHYAEYSTGRTSELLITDRKVCLTFVLGGANKPLGRKLAG